MKQKFSTTWRESKQKRKQRKYLFGAPLHIRHRFMSANLSKELRKKYEKRSFPLRKGDMVKIMKGKFKDGAGKVNSVDLKKLRVSVEGIQRQKKDGNKVNVYFSPSNLQIQELSLEDKKREKALKRKTEIKAVEEKKRAGGKNASKEK
jgi:large subunit ribosomal protein L24